MTKPKIDVHDVSPGGTPDSELTAVIDVGPFSDAEIAAIDAEAARRGMTRAEFLRAVAVDGSAKINAGVGLRTPSGKA